MIIHHKDDKLQLWCVCVYKFLLSRLIPYGEEIMGDHQCGFRCNTSITDHIFCIRQILEKKWEHTEAVHQLFIDFKKAYDSVRREALYIILIEFGIPKKLVGLIKMCLKGTAESRWVRICLRCFQLGMV